MADRGENERTKEWKSGKERIWWTTNLNLLWSGAGPPITAPNNCTPTSMSRILAPDHVCHPFFLLISVLLPFTAMQPSPNLQRRTSKTGTLSPGLVDQCHFQPATVLSHDRPWKVRTNPRLLHLLTYPLLCLALSPKTIKQMFLMHLSQLQVTAALDILLSGILLRASKHQATPLWILLDFLSSRNSLVCLIRVRFDRVSSSSS